MTYKEQIHFSLTLVFAAWLKFCSLVIVVTSCLQPHILRKSMLLSSFSSDAIFSKSEGLDITERLEQKEIGSEALEKNELGWAAGATEFEKETFSQASERFKEGFSEISHKELTLFSEIEFVTLSLDVTVDVEGKDKLIGLTLHFDFWQAWNCSLDCFEDKGFHTRELHSHFRGRRFKISIYFTPSTLQQWHIMVWLKLLKLSKITQWFTSMEQ